MLYRTNSYHLVEFNGVVICFLSIFLQAYFAFHSCIFSSGCLLGIVFFESYHFEDILEMISKLLPTMLTSFINVQNVICSFNFLHVHLINIFRQLNYRFNQI